MSRGWGCLLVVAIVVLGAIAFFLYLANEAGKVMDSDLTPHIPVVGPDCVATQQGVTPPATDASLEYCALPSSDLAGAKLVHADLLAANLTGAMLAAANLTMANLASANLLGADLRGADLTGAVLSGADLTGANLTSANLSNTDLRGADLTGANLTGATLDNAHWSSTVCPDGSNSGFSIAGRYSDPAATVPNPTCVGHGA